MRAKREEFHIHVAIVCYLRAVLPADWLVHHSRNGGMSKSENSRAKSMGALAGWPDIEIAGRETYGGLTVPATYYIEVKAPGGYTSSEQRKIHSSLSRLGCKVGIARSVDDVRSLIREWHLPSREVNYTSYAGPEYGGDVA